MSPSGTVLSWRRALAGDLPQGRGAAPLPRKVQPSVRSVEERAPYEPVGSAAAARSRSASARPCRRDLSRPESGNATFLVFDRENKLLGNHPITEGRDAGERINRIMTFRGQSLKGPEGSVAFLTLSDTALDGEPFARNATPPLEQLPDGRPAPSGSSVRTASIEATTSAAGRARGLAFRFGKGRVVVLGDAAVISAQVMQGPVAQLMGQAKILMGMNRPGFDNKKLALNIVHWLSGSLG